MSRAVVAVLRVGAGRLPFRCTIRVGRRGAGSTDGLSAAYFGTGNSRTSKSDSTVAQRLGVSSEHDSAATATGDP